MNVIAVGARPALNWPISLL